MINPLFPIFLKLETLHTLIVGGGAVGLEKLSTLLKNSPGAKVTVVATTMDERIREVAAGYEGVILKARAFRPSDLQGVNILVLATRDRALHQSIIVRAKKKNILVNAADDPALCDFYLGSVVSKGDLKIGISTHGKSPVLARRMREYLEEAIPGDMQVLIENLNRIRQQMKGDFHHKVKALNALTAQWLEQPEGERAA